MNSKKIEKMYKNKQVRLYLARELVFLEIGEKIPPMLELSKKYKISVGMIQKVFTDFQNESIIKCNKRGVLGSYIECIDNDKLLEESDFEYLIGVMPLPYSKKYEGLATGIKKSFQNKKINFHFAHMSGSQVRVEQLRKGVFDFAVISKLAFNLLSNKYDDIEIALKLGERSYVSKHVLLKSPNLKEVKTIGIDKNSYDQRYLTEKYFNSSNYNWVEIDCRETVKLLKNRIIDGIVGNLDEIKEKEIYLDYEELTSSEILKIASEAVIVVKKENSSLRKIIKKIIEKNYIMKIQYEVLNNNMLPTY